MHVAAYLPDEYKKEFQAILDKFKMNQSQFVRALILDALRREKK